MNLDWFDKSPDSENEVSFYGRLQIPNMNVKSLWVGTPLFKDHDYNIKIVFDKTTGELKSAEVLK